MLIQWLSEELMSKESHNNEQQGFGHITVAAAVEGPQQLLMFFVKQLQETYKISGIEYGIKNNNVSWVKCKIIDHAFIDFQKLLKLVETDLNTSEKLILSRRKTRKVVMGRSVIAFILRHRCGLLYSKIAGLMNQNHVPVENACKRFGSLDCCIKTCSLEEAYTIVKGRYKK